MHSELMVQLTINLGNMKRIYILSCVLLFASCSVIRPIKIVGTYKSTCVLYGSPDLVVSFNPDSTFVYKMPYVEEVVGAWIVKKDTLILYSDKFTAQSSDELTPRHKYTELEGKDAYLVKNGKLFSVTKTGIRKDCYLLKVNKY